MRRDEIVSYLKNKIISEEFPAGSYLPLRAELIRECEASNVTVQRAINQLTSEGFLRSCGSKGIMVSNYPPNKYRIGVLLPEGALSDNNFDTKHYAVNHALNCIEQSGSLISFARYYVGKETSQNDDEFKKLIADLKKHLLAGVIVPFALPDRLLAPLNGYPVIQLEPKNAKIIRSVSFNHNYVAMTEMALKQLIKSGARKIAVIMGSGMPHFFIWEIEKTLCGNSDIITKPEWVQSLAVNSRDAIWAGYLIKLLFSPEFKERPDGLIILNENLLLPIKNALKELNMIIGRDIHVCSHCNFPTHNTEVDNVHFIAFDWIGIFNKAIQYMKNFHHLEDSRFGREFILPPKIVDHPIQQLITENR